MLYNLNDSYYINQAIDSWLTDDTEDDAAQDEDVKNTKERCMSDD